MVGFARARARGLAALVGLAVTLGGTAAADELPLLRRPPDARAVAGVARLRELSESALRVRWSPFTGSVRSLSLRLPVEPSADAVGVSRRFLESNRGVVGWFAPLELRALPERRGLGSRHVRFRPHVDGLPVAGEVAVHLDARRGRASIVFVASSLPPRAVFDERWFSGDAARAALLAPKVARDEAVRAAETTVTRSRLGPSRARLEIATSPPPARLVWTVDIWSKEPHGLFRTRVDALTGEVRVLGDLLRRGFPGPAEGKGNVFLVNPIVALRDPELTDSDDSADSVPLEAYTEVALPELDGRGVLTGPFVSTEPTPGAVRRVRLEFPFLRDHDGFEEVMIYYHIDRAQRFVQSLGFDDIYNRRILAFANSQPPGIPFDAPQAFFFPDFESPTGVLAFGSGGVDFAEDPEVIIHEYGHALQHNQVPGFGFDVDFGGSVLETFAIGEGWADFLAASYLSAFTGGEGDACLGEWANAGFGAPCIRRVDSEKRFPADVVGEPHADGEMWSASLWKVHRELGREAALRLVFQSHFFLEPDAGFRDAAEAVIEADRHLHGGSHAAFLTGVFRERGFLSPPETSVWFWTSRPSGAARSIPADETRRFRLRIDRGGSITRGESPGFEVFLDVASPTVNFLGIRLRSPAGTRLQLHEIGNPNLPDGPFIFGRSVNPDETFDALEGEPVAGVWELEIQNVAFDPAVLGEWGLRFRGFVRGDADRNGGLDLNDSVTLLRYLFSAGELRCRKAADFGDDGRIDVTDAVGLLFHVFAGGAPPPPPFPEPGEDLTPDGLGCEN